MLLHTNRSHWFTQSHGASCGKRFANRRPRLESLERRTVLSTVSGVSAADAAVDSQSADGEQSPVLIGGVSTDPSIGDAAGVSTACPSGETSVFDWSQSLIKEQTAKEDLEGLKAKVKELKTQIHDLYKKFLKIFDEEWNPKLKELLKEREKDPKSEKAAELDAELRKIEERMKPITTELDNKKSEKQELEAKIKMLEEDLAQDQDGDALPDNPPADDASDLGLLIPGSVLDLCLPPSEWEALAAAHWGDGGMGYLGRFNANQDLDALAAAQASQGPAGDTHDLSSLDNDTGAIDFVHSEPSNLDNDTGAIDFGSSGWVEPPPDLLPLWR